MVCRPDPSRRAHWRTPHESPLAGRRIRVAPVQSCLHYSSLDERFDLPAWEWPHASRARLSPIAPDAGREGPGEPAKFESGKDRGPLARAPPWVSVSRELAYTDAADRQGSRVIALQPDQARGRQAVIGVGGKFARSYPALPVSVLELIFDDFVAIEPVLYMSALYNEARLVPMIERQHHTGRCAVERVGGRGGGEAALAVRHIRIIEELIFRTAPVDMIVAACAAVKDTAVAALADLPLEFELEISEALRRHQIVDRPVLGEHPAGNVPARR